MLKIIPVRVYAACIMLAAAPGCATHSANLTQAISAFKTGKDEAAIAIVEKGRDGKRCRQICCLEAGRLKMLAGRINESKADFMTAINEAADLEEGAVIRLRGKGGLLLASTLTDDRTIHYQLAGYELIMLLQEQALNHLFSGDMDAAMVEIRRAVYAQDNIAEAYEKDIEKVRKKIDDDKQKMEAYNDKVKNKYVAMGPVVGRVKNSFQNPYVWYSSGIMYEAAGEPGNAYISYKKAWELVPQNEYLQKDLLRLARKENPDEYKSFAEKFTGIDTDTLKKAGSEIIIFFEEGLISRRYSESITLPIPMPKGGFTYQTASFPVYRDASYSPVPVGIKLNGSNMGRTSVICYLQSLAYNDLMEKMPGIVLRNFTRGFARATSQQALSDQGAEFQIASLLWQIVNSAADRADTRAWYTIPMAVQIARLPVPAGTHELSLINQMSGLNTTLDLDIMENETKLVWIADIGGRASSCIASLEPRTDKIPGKFLSTASLLSTPLFLPATTGAMPVQNSISTGTSLAATVETPPDDDEPAPPPVAELSAEQEESVVEDIEPDIEPEPAPKQKDKITSQTKGRITVF